MNKLQTHNSTNITGLNEPIYAGAKLVCAKIGVLLKNTNRNSKAGWEIKQEKQLKIKVYDKKQNYKNSEKR